MHIMNVYLTRSELPNAVTLNENDWYFSKVGPAFDDEAITSLSHGKKYVEAIRSENGKQLYSVLEIKLYDASTSRTTNQILVARVAKHS